MSRYQSLFALLWIAMTSGFLLSSHRNSRPELAEGAWWCSLRSEVSNRNITGDSYLSISEIRHLSERKISCKVSWDASWREGDEYDAAWIFVKSKDRQGHWQHARIEPSSPHIIANRSSDGASALIKVSPDMVGMLIARAQDGAGNNHWTIVFELTEEAAATVEHEIFGLEMVHVAGGPFELGTLKGERARREILTPGAGGAPYNPFYTYQEGVRDNYGGIYLVKTEDAIDIGPTNGHLYWTDANIPGTNTYSGIPDGILSSDFPKGVNGFYQMKYELSQQEYCDFLNKLTPKQQETRDLSNTVEFDKPIQAYRNSIVFQEGKYTTGRPNRPCNFISWLDGQAYADWAGLRHMTELEFEKSCRGPEPAIYRAYVWGVNEINNSQNMRFSGVIYDSGEVAVSESGRETTDGNIHASMFSYRNFIDVCTPAGNFYDPDCVGCRSFEGGDGGRGPLRKGIFAATSNGDRIKAGATYFGAMEMGGNLQEPVVTVGHPSGRKFAGTHGDGHLTASGFADNLDWQPINGEYAFGGRGGCWKFHENHARIADRFKGLRTNPNRRVSHIGFRGVRTDWP